MFVSSRSIENFLESRPFCHLLQSISQGRNAVSTKQRPKFAFSSNLCYHATLTETNRRLRQKISQTVLQASHRFFGNFSAKLHSTQKSIRALHSLWDKLSEAKKTLRCLFIQKYAKLHQFFKKLCRKSTLTIYCTEYFAEGTRNKSPTCEV